MSLNGLGNRGRRIAPRGSPGLKRLTCHSTSAFIALLYGIVFDVEWLIQKHANALAIRSRERVDQVEDGLI